MGLQGTGVLSVRHKVDMLAQHAAVLASTNTQLGVVFPRTFRRLVYSCT